MNLALVKKTCRESMWLLLACAAILFSFCWLRVWIVGLIDTSRFKAILDLLPGDLERFSAVQFDWLVTYPGRIGLTYEEPIVILSVCIWAIARGSDVVSGEIGRGTMEMLLAQPVSRLQLMTSHAVVTVAGIGLLVAAGWAGTLTGIRTTTVTELVAPTINLPVVPYNIPIPLAEKEEIQTSMSEKVDAQLFLPASVNLFSLGFFLAGVTTWMSSWDRYRWRTIGIVVGAFVIQLIIKIAGMATDELHWLLYCTVLTAYEPEMFIQVAVESPEDTWNLLRSEAQTAGYWLGPLGYHLTLVVTGLVAYVAAAITFCRRDLPAPL